MMSTNKQLLCIGEVLWDALPAGLFLGGAPFNVACHLHMLGADVTFASRVGDDRLGREVRRRMSLYGMDDTLLQSDPVLPTGFVEVALAEGGIPVYDIVEPAAWDEIALTDAMVERAGVVVFGCLAQRRRTSRETIQALTRAAALTVFDVNMRPPYVDRAVIEASLRQADVVKLNDEEMALIGTWWGLPADEDRAAAALAERFGNRSVCVTRGERGAALWHAGTWTEHPGYTVAVRDTVGAGDAFLAGLLYAQLSGYESREALDFACRLGAFVASQSGATPVYRISDLDAMSLSV